MKQISSLVTASSQEHKGKLEELRTSIIQRVAQHKTGSIVVLHQYQREVKHISNHNGRANVASKEEDEDDDKNKDDENEDDEDGDDEDEDDKDEDNEDKYSYKYVPSASRTPPAPYNSCSQDLSQQDR